MDHALAGRAIGQGTPGRPRVGDLDSFSYDQNGNQALDLIDLQRPDSEFEPLDARLSSLDETPH